MTGCAGIEVQGICTINTNQCVGVHIIYWEQPRRRPKKLFSVPHQLSLCAVGYLSSFGYQCIFFLYSSKSNTRYKYLYVWCISVVQISNVFILSVKARKESEGAISYFLTISGGWKYRPLKNLMPTSKPAGNLENHFFFVTSAFLCVCAERIVPRLSTGSLVGR